MICGRRFNHRIDHVFAVVPLTWVRMHPICVKRLAFQWTKGVEETRGDLT